MPKVTIGIPVFNESAYIESTLMSALSQFKSYSDLEIVISNNASTDDSFEKINEIIESHIFKNKAKIINQSENIGAANNFWNIFDRTDSELFIWLGGHDLLSEDFIKNGVNFLSANPEYSMFSGQHLAIDENNDIDDKNIPYDFTSNNPYERYLLSILKLNNCYIFHSLFNRAHLLDYPRYNCPSEDHIIIGRLLWKGKLHQSTNCAYMRRYFSNENRIEKENGGSYVTPRNNIIFFESYLTDIKILSSSVPPNVRSQMIKTAGDLLFKRLGLPFIIN